MQRVQPEGSKCGSCWHDVAPGSMVDLVVTLARHYRGVMLQSLLQDFILSQVTFSIINAGHTAAVLVQMVVGFAQQIIAFVERSSL